MTIRKLASWVGLLALTFAASAQATVVVSNLSQSTFGTDSGVLVAAGQQFTTGSTTENLQSVTLRLLGSADSLNVSLYSDNAGNPGTSLLSLGSLTPSGSGYANYSLTAPSAFSLVASTAYWVVATYNGTPSWAYTYSTSYTGTGSLGNVANSTTGVGSWTTYSGAFEPYQLEVDSGAASVPEPSTLALIGLGVVGLGFGRRKKTR